MLKGINGVVAVNLFLTDGVFFMPAYQHGQSPGVEVTIGEHGRRVLVEIAVVIAGAHVEQQSGNVAFEGIDGLENGARKAWDGTTAYLRAVATGPVCVAHFAKGQVASFVVHLSVGRVHVKQISVHGCLAIEPAFGYYKLTVIAITFAIITATLINNRSIFVRWGAARNVGVDVPYFAIAFDISVGESVPQTAVCQRSGIGIDNLRQGQL